MKIRELEKKLEPTILVVVIILLGFIVAIFSNLINFEIKKFVVTFIGIPILLVIGSWIISVFSIKETTKKRLGILFIIIAVLGFSVYFLYENRQVIYDLKKEIDTVFKNDKNIDTTKNDMTVDEDTESIIDEQGNSKIVEPIIKINQFTFIVKQGDKLIANAIIEVETQNGIFDGKTDEKGKALMDIKGEIDPNISYTITVNGIVFKEPIKKVTTLILPK
eukprot:TRINITY_DN22917_c0_g1_i1.p2 TRINITY_DN22917_c0_g1~~TRINITY_DN22917_c0_g1_i1.p2  ORF type:complete len:220 (+),score=36.10 TRINITY_DN22917_c0_g1_i1:313-972(+)